MIKCNVTLCGTVSKEASERTNKEGNQVVDFTVNVVIPAKSGINKTVTVSVIQSKDLWGANTYNVGDRVTVTGVLVPKKRGENITFNLFACKVDAATEEDKDGITGTMEFRGKTGKKIETKTDKKGKPFTVFSAFSAEKVQETFEYIWVRFLLFDSEPAEWLQPGVKAEIKGALSLQAYNDKIDFSCRVEEMNEYVPNPYNGQ